MSDVTVYVRRRGDIDLVIDSCPYCGQRHSHGSGGESGPDFGHRVPHCLPQKVLPRWRAMYGKDLPQYRLVEQPGPKETRS